MKKISITILFLMFIAFSHSQENSKYPFISTYNKLYTKNQDSALVFCNELISDIRSEKKAFGYAGKAYINALKSKYKLADELFNKAEAELNKIDSKKIIELKANIIYLKGLRFVVSLELVKAIEILNDVMKLCDNNCSSFFKLKIHSSLGRAYSMSNKHMEAIAICKSSLNEIKKSPNFSKSNYLKKEYVRQLVKYASRTLNLYQADKEQYLSYLDSTQTYISMSKKYSESYKISDYNSYILGLYGEINYFKERYSIAKNYYNKVVELHKKDDNIKKAEQSIFRIAECDFYLGNYDEAEATFLRHVKSDMWSDYNRITINSDIYFYLYRIYEKKGDSDKAYEYGTKSREKLKEYYEAKHESDLKINDMVHLDKREKEIEDYQKKYQTQEEEKKLYLYTLLISVIVVSFLIGYFIYAKRRDKENISKLHLRIEQLEKDVSKQTISKQTSSLSDEGALKLLEKLKALEKEELFQQPNYTLNLVAKKLQTNSSYLSKTVNEYMDITFAEYSNRLRINSIIKKINKQKVYRTIQLML